MAVLGIDPGWGGGAALIGDGNIIYEAVSFATLTEVEIVQAVSRLAFGAHIAYIEKVGAMPKQGVVSMFKFGHAYGLARGVLIEKGIGIIEISPLKWQTTLNCRTGGDKKVTKQKAQIIFGSQIAVTHGIADALLIAYYGVHYGSRM